MYCNDANVLALTNAEIAEVCGGFSWGYAASAVAAGGATALAIITAPETMGMSLLLLGAASGGFSTGVLAGQAITH